MRSKPDEVAILDLNVPGTHDTATWNYTQLKQTELLQYTGPIAPAAFYRYALPHESTGD
jgi:1-phosphatidylinositol phosphodiesterase